MCTRNTISANTGIVTISTPNPNLDGTGSLGPLLTASVSANRTIVSNITVKAVGNTTRGMVRLFIDNGISTNLYREIAIPAMTQTSVSPTFGFTLQESIELNPGDIILASTENAETFNVIANAHDLTNCSCSEDSCTTVQLVANTGLAMVNAANPNLNGTGSMASVITATTGANAAGTEVLGVTIKAQATTRQGMIRFFVNDGVNNYLLREIYVPEITRSAIVPTYKITTFLGILLTPGYSIKVSTQVADVFNILIPSQDIINCPCA